MLERDAPEPTPDDDNKKKRLWTTAFVCCIFLLAIVLGLGLGLGLRDDDDDQTPAPTPAPTPNITAGPTLATSTAAPTGENETPPPTMGGTVVEVTVVASADTTIFVDGQFAGDNFGTEDTMLVQGGEAGNNDLPKAYSLVQFELNSTELSMLPEPVEIEFCLDHVESTADPERVVTYTACLVPFNSPISELTGSNATYTFPDDCIGGNTASFDISPSDQTFCIPATEMVLGSASSTTRARRLRGQRRGGSRKLLMLDDVFVLAILNPSQSDQSGDRFYTSNDAEGRVPLMEFTSLTSNFTDFPTDIPTETLEPNVTEAPTDVPTDTLSPNATDLPTATLDPNATEVPEPQYEPCSICGNNLTVTIPDAEVPQSEGQNCGTVEEACKVGFCSPEQCELLPLLINDICGCTTAPDEVGI